MLQKKIRDSITRVLDLIRDNPDVAKNFAIGFGVLTAAVVTLTAAIAVLTSPLTLILGLIAAGAAAFAAFKKFEKPVREFFDNVKSKIDEFLQNPFVQKIIQMFKKLANEIGTNLKEAGEALKPLQKASLRLGKKVLPVIGAIAGVIGTVLAGAITGVVFIITELFVPAINIMTGMFNFVSGVIDGTIQVFTSLSGILGATGERIKVFTTSITNRFKTNFNLIKKTVSSIFIFIGSFIITQVQKIRNTFENLKMFIQGIFIKIKQTIKSILISIGSFILSKINNIKNHFGGIFDKVKNVFNKVRDFIRNVELPKPKLPEINFPDIKAPDLKGVGRNFPGFAQGGSFQVGGRGGVDNNLVAFRASRGERVTVQTKEQQKKSSAKNIITINNNFNDSGLSVKAVSDRLAFQLNNLQ